MDRRLQRLQSRTSYMKKEDEAAGGKTVSQVFYEWLLEVDITWFKVEYYEDVSRVFLQNLHPAMKKSAEDLLTVPLVDEDHSSNIGIPNVL